MIIVVVVTTAGDTPVTDVVVDVAGVKMASPFAMAPGVKCTLCKLNKWESMKFRRDIVKLHTLHLKYDL